MTSQKSSNVSAEKLALFEKLVATIPGVEVKGNTIPYTSLNGNMFSYISKDGIYALRLPEEVREAFIERFKTKLMEAYGIVQKEYVAVPDKVFKDTKILKLYFKKSFEYVNSLKPKATKKLTKKK